MKYGSHQKANSVECYYQTLFNIALILEQVQNYNNVLREQESVEKSSHRIQNNMIREENIIRSRMSATAKECMLNVSYDKNMNNKNKDMNEDN